MPAGTPIRGFVCKAARALLGQTQDALASAADISRKTLFDFEVGEIEPKIALINRIRKALEDAGANFVTGDNVVGVVVYSRPVGGMGSQQA
jgi:DNA-binding XRE family transcriptional regulator